MRDGPTYARPLASRRKGGSGDETAVVLAAVLTGLFIAAVVRHGAFYTDDATLVAVVSGALVLARLVLGADRRALVVAAGVSALALWWLARASAYHVTVAFLPLGASMVAFLGAFLVVRALAPGQRPAAALALVGVIAGAATVGLVAMVARWYPQAARAQDHWRLATTLTYSSAAGALLVVGLLVAVALDQRRWWHRAAVCLCTAAALATESRGAAVALVVGATCVPLSCWRGSARPLAAGLVAGAALVATSASDARQPLAGAVVVLATAAAVVPLFGSRPRWLAGRRALVVAVAAAVVVLAVGGLVLRGPIGNRLGQQDRSPEWSAAFTAFTAHPLLGSGPDRPLLLDAATRRYAPFAQNEYLQVLAGAGVIGGVLLVAAAAAVGRAVRREDALTSCALGAVLAFAVVGVFDFDWHLPAVALAGGWAAGLAGVPPGPAGVPPGGARSRSAR